MLNALGDRDLDNLQQVHTRSVEGLLRNMPELGLLSTDHRSNTSETATFLSQGNTEVLTEREHQPASEKHILDGQLTWRPLTLRLPYLSWVVIVTIFLASLVLFLTMDSVRNHGLGDDNASASLLFGWRFSPTLLATIYGLFVASILNDVRRTEIFARLSRPGGAPAETTLCFPIRSWWHDPKDALNKSTQSYALLYASILYILALLVSPLSAGLLSPADEQSSLPRTFHRAKVENFSWQHGNEDEIMFRTISGGVIGQSTSVWVSTSAAILPFWPPGYGNAPLGSKFATTLQFEQWQAQTTAYTVDLDCHSMPLLAKYNATYNYTDGVYTNYTFLRFGLQDDCVITLADGDVPEPAWLQYGGGWWAPPPLYNTSLLSGMSNSTSSCGNHTMFFYATPASNPMRFQANLCSANFYSSEVLATVSLNQSSTDITFSQDENLRNRRPLDPAIYNISQLQDAFFSSNWSSHFLSFPNEDTPVFGGPLMSITAGDKYSNNITKLFASSSLPQEANELYQQFFGEMLLATFSLDTEKNAESVPGRVIVFQRRIVASLGVGIALVAVLLTSSICVVLIAYSTSLHRRVLNLNQDPGTICAATQLISANSDVRAAFENTDRLSQQSLTHRLRTQKYMLIQGDLLSIDKEDEICLEGGMFHCYDTVLIESLTSLSEETDAPSQKKRDPRPIVLRGWIGILLGSLLLLLTAAITVLYIVFRTAGLHQAPFVYRMTLHVRETAATLAPYKIVPTLLALGVKLWFGAVADALKMVQPYISMVQAPVPVTNSVMVEYANTPIALAATKALNNAHWTLALVALGALASEFC